MSDEPKIRSLFGGDDYATAQPGGKPPLGLWTAAEDNDQIPHPRDWLLGNTFCRGYLSSLVAEGGTGKTALRLAQCIALAAGRGDIAGGKVFAQTRVLYISLEDDADELRRRVRAALMHHGVSYESTRDWLYLATPATEWEPKQPVSAYTIAYATRWGELKVGEFLTKLSAALFQYRFGLVVIDPFVKLHGANENSNPEIDYVCRVLAQLAAQYHCAIDVPHHVNKLIGEGSRSNRTRGASAFRDAVRLLYTLTSMTVEEAAEMNIDDRERLSLVRLDPGKLNITVPASDATWYKLVGVRIGNGNETYPNGDDVQTVERWIAPDIWKNLTNELVSHILDEFSNGLPDGRKYGLGNVGQERQGWRVIQKFAPELTDKQAKIVLRKWEENGMIDTVTYTDPVKRQDQKGIIVRRWPG
jgi:hypothetical protein